MELNRLTYSIHLALVTGEYSKHCNARTRCTTASDKTRCKPHSKEERYDLIKSICEASKANQRLIQLDLEPLVDTSECEYHGEIDWNDTTMGWSDDDYEEFE